VPAKTDVQLSGELEQIAVAAADRLRALTAGDLERDANLQRRVGEAASRAIAAGLSLAASADAEQIGRRRARAELGPEVLRRVERAARRKREAEHEYEVAVVRAGRLGLAHRDVAAAAQVAHGTVRAIIARACATPRQHAVPTTSATEAESGQQLADATGAADASAEQVWTRPDSAATDQSR
jgi:hypothetical protein